MKKLIVSTFASLDGIMQAPGGPEEDPTGGFSLGGWMFNYADKSVDISSAGFDGKDRDLLLGRRTYEIFEAYWPYQSEDNPVAKSLNAAKKYVASRTLTSTQWNNSTLLGEDAVSAIKSLKTQAGRDLQIIGSGNLIQTLQDSSLIDEYNVWTFPVVLSRGKRLFSETAKPLSLRLVRSQVSATGCVMTTYVPAGEIQPGTFASTEPSQMELARRKKNGKSNLVIDFSLRNKAMDMIFGRAILRPNSDYSSRWRSDMVNPAKNTICVWYDADAEEAAQFYAKTFPNSSVGAVHRAPGDYPSGKKGDVLMVEFIVVGIPCIGLNGGPGIKHNEAFSFLISTTDQVETDRYWNAIVGNGGREKECGWCEDKWGISWQITPAVLTKAVTDSDTTAAKRAFDAMMQMKKIDVAAIEAAYRG